MRFGIYTYSDGKIDRVIECPDESVAYEQCSQAEQFIYMPSLISNDSTHYVAGGELVAFPSQPSVRHTWNWSTKTWDAPDLSVVKEDKWAEIKLKRTEVEQAGFEWDVHTFDSDYLSQQRVQGAAQFATLALVNNIPSWSIDWTLADNSVITLSAPQMIDVGVTMGNFISSVHGIARTLRDEIESATSVEEIAAVQWP